MSSLRKENIIFFIVLLLVFIHSSIALAWNGYDYEKNVGIEINSGNLVRDGELIKFYDWGTGDYHNAEIKSVDDDFNSVKVEILDLDTKETRTFQMEKN